MQEAQARHAAMIKDIQKLGHQLFTVRNECAARTATAAAATSNAEELQQQLGITETRASELTSSLADARGLEAKLQASRAALVQDIIASRSAAVDTTAECAALRGELDCARLQAAATAAENADLKATVQGVSAQAAAVSTENADLAAAVQGMRAQAAAVSTENVNLQAAVGGLSAQAEVAECAAVVLREEVVSALARGDAVEARAAAAEHERDLYELIARDAQEETEETERRLEGAVDLVCDRVTEVPPFQMFHTEIVPLQMKHVGTVLLVRPPDVPTRTCKMATWRACGEYVSTCWRPSPLLVLWTTASPLRQL